MGIPGMYRFVQNYNDSQYVAPDGTIGTVIKTGLPNKNGNNHLFLDFNGGIYTAFNVNKCTTIESLINNTLGYLDLLIQIYDLPSDTTASNTSLKTVFLAIDGVPPRAKIEQQRTRRFHSIDEKNKIRKLDTDYNETPTTPNPIDTNMITPGTEFMEALHQAFHKHIDELHSKYPSIKFIYSGYNTPLEGEHKLMRYIKKATWTSNDQILVYGLDADLIMLSIIASKYNPNIYLLREKTEFGNFAFEYEGHKFLYLDIYETKQSILSEFKTYLEDVMPEEDIQHERMIDDFVFFCYILGNDFIPHIPHLSLDNNGCDKLMSVYCNIYNMHRDFLVNRNTMQINHLILLRIFEELARTETEDMRNYHKHRQRKKIRLDCVNNKLEEEMQKMKFFPLQHLYIEKKIDPFTSRWQERYYNTCFNRYNPDGKDDVVKRYLESLVWTFRYYFKEVDSWSWFYPYHYGPLCSDVFSFLERMKDAKLSLTNINQIEFYKGKPIKPQELLVMVLPLASKNLMANEIQKQLDMKGSPLKRFFPSSYKISIPYNTFYWQCRPILDAVNYKTIHEEMNKVKLTREETKRNKNVMK